MWGTRIDSSSSRSDAESGSGRSGNGGNRSGGGSRNGSWSGGGGKSDGDSGVHSSVVGTAGGSASSHSQGICDGCLTKCDPGPQGSSGGNGRCGNVIDVKAGVIDDSVADFGEGVRLVWATDSGGVWANALIRANADGGRRTSP